MRSRAASSLRISATVPRKNSSCSLVSSRATTAWSRGPIVLRCRQVFRECGAGLVKNQRARSRARVSLFAGSEVFEKGAARAGFFRKESEEVEIFSGESRGDERADGRVGAGNGDDLHSGGNGFAHQPTAGVIDGRSSRVGDECDALPAFMFWMSSVARCARCAGGN